MTHLSQHIDDGCQFIVNKKAMKFDSSGKQLYIGACKMLKQVPASYYLRQSDGDTMRIRHHSLGEQVVNQYSSDYNCSYQLL